VGERRGGDESRVPGHFADANKEKYLLEMSNLYMFMFSYSRGGPSDKVSFHLELVQGPARVAKFAATALQGHGSGMTVGDFKTDVTTSESV
jgi:hypothetical protein